MSTEPKPTIAAEFLTAFAAEPAPAAPAVSAQAPAPSEDGTPAPVVVEAPKPDAPKPEATPSLARRLALLAAGEKRARDASEAQKKADAERAARDAEINPVLERITKAKSAKSKMEAAAIALGLDDEGIAELYIELDRFHAENPDKKPKADPSVDIEKLIKAKLEEAFATKDAERKASEEKKLNDFREAHVSNVLAALDAKGDEFPLVSIAPPPQVDITAISEAWLTANGEIPEPEAVLKLIQDERQLKLDERRKAAEKKASAKPAPEAKATGETSGGKAKPIRDNDVTVTAPRKLSIAEEFSEAYRAQSGG